MSGRLALLLIALAALATVAPVPVYAQAPDTTFVPEPETVYLPLPYRVGRRFEVVVQKEQRRQVADHVSVLSDRTTRYDAAVVTDDQYGFVHVWTEQPDPSVLDDPLVQRVVENLGELHVDALRFRTDPAGAPTALINIAAVRALLALVADQVLAMLNEEDEALTPEQAAQFETFMKGLVTSDTYITEQILQVPSLLSIPFDSRYTPGDTLTFDDFLPNFTGGPPIPSIGYATLAEVDEPANTALFVWGQTMAPEAVRRLVREFARGAGADPATLDEMPALGMEDRAEYRLDLTSGLVRQLVYTRTARTGDETHVNRLVVEMRIRE